MGKDRAAQTPGAGRRGVLKNIMTLGVAAPLAGLLSGTACEATPGGTGQPQVNGTGQPQVKLTPAQLAGQRVIYSYPGLTVPTALLRAIRAGQAAGVIFFGDNISSDAQLAAAIAQLVKAQKQSPVAAPLLLMTDQEGG